MSPVVGVVLMIAVVVVLVAVVGGAVLSIGIPTPAPFVASSTGEFLPQDGSDGGIVKISHENGDSFRVSTVSIVVDATDACGKVGRLVTLPATGGDPRPTDEFVRGDDVFDNSFNSVSGPIGEDERTVDGSWDPGDVASFRIASGACPVTDGDGIVVRIVHEPSNSVIIQHRLVL